MNGQERLRPVKQALGRAYGFRQNIRDGLGECGNLGLGFLVVLNRDVVGGGRDELGGHALAFRHG